MNDYYAAYKNGQVWAWAVVTGTCACILALIVALAVIT
jgi:hypothetical protein